MGKRKRDESDAKISTSARSAADSFLPVSIDPALAFLFSSSVSIAHVFETRPQELIAVTAGAGEKADHIRE
jgi:hypothetical protein